MQLHDPKTGSLLFVRKLVACSAAACAVLSSLICFRTPFLPVTLLSVPHGQTISKQHCNADD